MLFNNLDSIPATNFQGGAPLVCTIADHRAIRGNQGAGPTLAHLQNAAQMPGFVLV